MPEPELRARAGPAGRGRAGLPRAASRPRRPTASSTRWCGTPPTRACSRAGGRSCTPGSRAALEERFPETAEAEPELLAHHFTEAGLAERAIVYLQRAARRALARSADLEAVEHLRAALGQLDRVGEAARREVLEFELQAALGRALSTVRGFAAPETDRAYARAAALGQRLQVGSRLFPVLWGRFVALRIAGQLPGRPPDGAGVRAARETVRRHRPPPDGRAHLRRQRVGVRSARLGAAAPRAGAGALRSRGASRARAGLRLRPAGGGAGPADLHPLRPRLPGPGRGADPAGARRGGGAAPPRQPGARPRLRLPAGPASRRRGRGARATRPRCDGWPRSRPSRSGRAGPRCSRGGRRAGRARPRRARRRSCARWTRCSRSASGCCRPYHLALLADVEGRAGLHDAALARVDEALRAGGGDGRAVVRG